MAPFLLLLVGLSALNHMHVCSAGEDAEREQQQADQALGGQPRRNLKADVDVDVVCRLSRSGRGPHGSAVVRPSGDRQVSAGEEHLRRPHHH